MIRTLTTLTLTQIATASINRNFFNGFETGIHVQDIDKFEDFKCPEPEMSSQVESMVGMFKMAKGMMKPQNSKQNLNQTANIIDKIDIYADQIAIIASVMDNKYEGGDFCAGLTLGYESRQVG